MPKPKVPGTVNTIASSMAQEVTVVSQVPVESLEEHMFGVEVIPPIEIDRGGDSLQAEANEIEAKLRAAAAEKQQRTDNLNQAEEATKGFVTSKHVEVNAMRPQDVDDILSASIIARPMTLPDHLDQRARDSNFRLRWVNFKANGGARYEQLKAAGFRNARAEEVVGLNGSLTQDASGIRYNDTILMIIPTHILLGAYKYNFLRSQNMVSRSGSLGKAKNVADAEMQKLINSEHISADYLKDPNMGSKVNFYVPGEKDTAGI